MKIGDRVFVRGYIDEIRKDTVIIRNAGGYFGTIPSEVIIGDLPPAQPEINTDWDVISRHEAIDALAKEYRCTDKSDDWDGLKTAMLIIENLPSAQPEQFNPCTVCQEFDCTGCKFRRTE
jgi:hypothetical protein